MKIGLAIFLSCLLHIAFFGLPWKGSPLLVELFFGNGKSAPIWVTVNATPTSSLSSRAARKRPAVSSKVESSAPVNVKREGGVGGGEGKPEESLSMDQLAKWGNRIPHYPREAEIRGWQGKSRLKVMFNSDVNDVELIQSSGYPILDDAALEAARTWHLPSAPDPKVTRVVTVEFVLDE